MTRRDMDRQREYKAALLLAVFGAVLVTILMILVFVESWQQDAALQTQQETDATPEKLTIENPDPCDPEALSYMQTAAFIRFTVPLILRMTGRTETKS